MSADLERLLHDAAAAPRTVVDPDEIVAVSRRRRGRRRRGAAVLALLLVVAAGLTVPRLAGDLTGFASGGPIAVLPLPPRGEVAPEFLPDGTPVFVVHDRDGTVHVLEALHPYGTLEQAAVGWCSAADGFIGVWTGSYFDRSGAWLGGPSPHGLARFEATVRDRAVEVGERRDGAPRSATPGGGNGSLQDCWAQSPDMDLSLDATVVHGEPWTDAVAPSSLAGSAVTGDFVVRGVILELPDGRVELCDALAQADGPAPRCAAPSLVREAGQNPPHGMWYGLHGHARVWLEDGRLTRIVLLDVTGFAGVYDPSAGPTSPPAAFGPEDRVVLSASSLVVPARDIAYPEPPGPLDAGRYHVRLENHGGIRHTLVHEGGNLRLATAPFEAAEGVVELDPGEHVFYCEIPGHREAGMVLTLTVR